MREIGVHTCLLPVFLCFDWTRADSVKDLETRFTLKYDRQEKELSWNCSARDPTGQVRGPTADILVWNQGQLVRQLQHDHLQQPAAQRH